MAKDPLSSLQVKGAGEGDHPGGEGRIFRVTQRKTKEGETAIAASWVLRYSSSSGKRRAFGQGKCDRNVELSE